MERGCRVSGLQGWPSQSLHWYSVIMLSFFIPHRTLKPNNSGDTRPSTHCVRAQVPMQSQMVYKVRPMWAVRAKSSWVSALSHTCRGLKCHFTCSSHEWFCNLIQLVFDPSVSGGAAVLAHGYIPEEISQKTPISGAKAKQKNQHWRKSPAPLISLEIFFLVCVCLFGFTSRLFPYLTILIINNNRCNFCQNTATFF